MDGIAVGLNKGHQVTKKSGTPRPSRRKGFLSQRVKKVSFGLRGIANSVSLCMDVCYLCAHCASAPIQPSAILPEVGKKSVTRRHSF